MEARARTPEDIFGTHIRYIIPPFQRPYVWTEEKQWVPLWADVERIADHVHSALVNGDPLPQRGGRLFLGAIVLQELPNATGFIQTRSVVDGQQRLTTLQVLLDAVQLVAEELGREDDAEALRDLVLNNPKKAQSLIERFKVWPSRTDREGFQAAMDDDLQVPDHLRESLIPQAHEFFRRAAHEWATQDSEPQAVKRRVKALTLVLHRHVEVVAIDLEPGDNPQLIFEALNDRGTPLLAADLIKNYLFMAVEQAGADAGAWEEAYWKDFDDDWWRQEVAQGRFRRSRLDIFFQYWLTMQTRDEVPTDQVFRTFRDYAEAHGVDSADRAQRLLGMIRDDAAQFRGFAEFEPHSIEETFYYRVVEGMETGAVAPVLLWLLIDRHHVDQDQRTTALAAIESWIIRRNLLRLTSKDYNRVFVGLLKALTSDDAGPAGDRTVAFLGGQTAPSRYWPKDVEVRTTLTSTGMYRRLATQRIRVVLEAIEDHLHTPKTETEYCPRGLQVEHVMPQSWRKHWGADLAPDDLRGEIQRDRAVQMLGNLTLVTSALNPALSNNPWLTSQEAGEGKRDQLNGHSLLLMTRQILDHHPQAWTEVDITARSDALGEAITHIWPGPPAPPPDESAETQD